MSFSYHVLVFILLGINFSAYAFADVVYVYRNSNSLEPLTFENSRHIFDGGTLTWDNGKNIVLLVDELDKIDDKSFLKFAGLSKSQYLSQWRIKFFSGRALIPIQTKSISFASETLITNPSAIFFSFKEYTDEELGAQKNNLKLDKITF